MNNGENKKGKWEDFFEGVRKYAGDNFAQAEDIKRLVKISFEQDEIESLEDLAFQGKYITGLMRIIRNRDDIVDDEYFEKIKSEYAGKIDNIKSLLKNLVEKEGSFLTSIFEEKYFQMTQLSLQNLNSLCQDLKWVKYYLNDLKNN
jgi:hypothetical protein